MTALPSYRCPRCLGALVASETELVSECGSRYPIVDGIPRFVPTDSYADAFGAQWLRHADTQLDSVTGTPITGNRAKRIFGPLWDQLDGQRVLECGAGAGRFTEVLLGQGADVTAIDLTRAVESNARHHAGRPGFRVAMASILELPFTPRQFDIVFCPGVVQHTPDTEWTVACLYEQVRPGGWLVFDHYRYNAASILSTMPLFRPWMRRLPAERGMRLTERIVDALLPVHRVAAKWRPAEMLLFRVSPVTAHYRGYPELSDEMQREWALLATHDHLTDFYKRHRTVGQIERLLAHLGAADVVVWKMPYTVEARARRP